MYKWYRHRAFRRTPSFKTDTQGATAIEFAILALPFFALIFGILELAIILFINSTLTHAVGEAGRQIRIGNFQACAGNKADLFKGLVCDNMAGLGSCQTRVRVDVKTGTKFATITLPDPNEPADEDTDIVNGTVDSTNGGMPVIARAIYYYKLALPAQITRLETVKGSGIRKLAASTAFRNEPFSTPGTCPTP